jgi:AraC-like DNA-binding protein
MLALVPQIGWLSRNPNPSVLEIIGPASVRRSGLRKLSLTLDELRPVIHLAHRLRGPLELRTRVILDYELLLILDGRGEIEVGHDVRGFNGGDLFVMAPFVPHRFACRSQSFEHIAVHFRFAPELPSLAELHDQRPYALAFEDGYELRPHVRLEETDPARVALEQVVRLWAENKPLATLNAEALLMNVVSRLLFHPRASKPTPVEPAIDPRILNALDRIDGHATARPRISELAAAVNLGRTQFNSLFRQQVNETPSSYIRRRQAARACELLVETDWPIKTIALSHGFSDAAHFSRAFFRACGCWPTEYRKRSRAR